MDLIAVFKAAHIIGFVAWFGGLFYLGRLFIYHVEANDKTDTERDILQGQFNIMMQKVYKVICNPAMMLTWTCGGVLIYLNTGYMTDQGPWLHVKLTLLLVLMGYHIYSKLIMKKLLAGQPTFDSLKLRMWNEVPTVLLIGIVILAVFKQGVNPGIVFGIMAVLAILFYVVIKSVNKKKAAKNEE